MALALQLREGSGMTGCDSCGTAEREIQRSDELDISLCGPCFAARTAQADSGSLAVVEERVGLTLPVLSLDAALADIPDRPEWCWDGFIGPRTVTLIAGRPKVGKSTFLFGLIGALESGRAFAGRATRQAGVLLLTEERQSTLKPKVERFGISGQGVQILMRHQIGGVDWHAIAELAAAYCKAHALRVLVVDTWDKWSGLTGERENSAGDVTEALAPLLKAAGQGLAVVIVSHQRKSAGSHGEAVRGSNALTGGVDVVTELERMQRGAEELDPDARLLKSLSRYDETPAELGVRLVDDGYEATDREALRVGSERERIRDRLTQIGEVTADAETAKALGMRKQSLLDRLQEMRASGEVERQGSGKKGDPFRFLPRDSVLGTENSASSLRAPSNEDSADSVPKSRFPKGERGENGRHRPEVDAELVWDFTGRNEQLEAVGVEAYGEAA